MKLEMNETKFKIIVEFSSGVTRIVKAFCFILRLPAFDQKTIVCSTAI